ncbi:kinase-like domain-containing protein [Rhizophagus diaphanus]|nr:kinase-like domain-containing protein [Rhizophagus diaphanus] [Rhizophagus sp. MUCL 43196]
MAPEILRGKHFTPASDIYSFSMIMWEFTSGVPPFNDKAHDFQLSLSICRGERPNIIKNTPQCYVDLMKKCWDEDPLKRPSSKEVLNIIEEWIILPYEKEIEDISKELKCYVMEFINTPIGNNNLVTATESHPQACYTSRVLDFTSKKLNKYLESECLDNCRINDDMNSLDIETDEN